ncbi:MAG: hypothetical protein ABR616_18755 [Dermatophilaceae bacterium]
MKRDELLAGMAADLSADILLVMMEDEHTIEKLVDAVIPQGSPGSQFHRPFLHDALADLVDTEDPLDPLTCLQVCHAMGWTLGIVSVEKY